MRSNEIGVTLSIKGRDLSDTNDREAIVRSTHDEEGCSP